MTGDVATVTVSVAVPPAQAFEVFTRDIDLWWQRGLRFRNAGLGPSRMVLEAGVGGRFVELSGEGATQRAIEIGHITHWDPPARLAMRWRNSNFAARESTQLEIAFVAFGSGTRVTVRHHGWSALPADHPARHGRQGAAFIRTTGLWWGDVLSAYRTHTNG